MKNLVVLWQRIKHALLLKKNGVMWLAKALAIRRSGVKRLDTHGRKALVGQYVTSDGVDQSESVNYMRSKKYPHSSTRQQERERRKHANH